MSVPLPADLILRPGRPGDEGDALAVFRTSVEHLAAGHYYPSQIRAWQGLLTAEDLRGAAEDGSLVVVEQAGSIIAFGRFVVSTGEVASVYVHPAFSGHGIGRILMEHFEQLARSAGRDRLFLRASLNALPFYLACGFREIGRVQHTGADGTCFECIQMEKALSPDS
ncbi:MAG: GCN5 family acetyltransferase [Armatimonadota bacterium]|nr:MAG: GCN5 family acetyltransferase [Armatimonadota bacterium]